MRRPFRYGRLHRVIGVALVIALGVMWLLSRWWYVKWTRRDSGGMYTAWICSGRTTGFMRRVTPTTVVPMPPLGPIPASARSIPAAPPLQQGTTLELIPTWRIGAIPGWQWGFDQESHPFATGGGEWWVSIPLWAPAALILAAVLLPTRSELRRGRGRCGACGYDLTGNTSGVCPECGQRSPTDSARARIAATSRR